MEHKETISTIAVRPDDSEDELVFEYSSNVIEVYWSGSEEILFAAGFEGNMENLIERMLKIWG